MGDPYTWIPYNAYNYTPPPTSQTQQQQQQQQQHPFYNSSNDTITNNSNTNNNTNSINANTENGTLLEPQYNPNEFYPKGMLKGMKSTIHQQHMGGQTTPEHMDIMPINEQMMIEMGGDRIREMEENIRPMSEEYDYDKEQLMQHQGVYNEWERHDENGEYMNPDTLASMGSSQPYHYGMPYHVSLKSTPRSSSSIPRKPIKFAKVKQPKMSDDTCNFGVRLFETITQIPALIEYVLSTSTKPRDVRERRLVRSRTGGNYVRIDCRHPSLERVFRSTGALTRNATNYGFKRKVINDEEKRPSVIHLYHDSFTNVEDLVRVRGGSTAVQQHQEVLAGMTEPVESLQYGRNSAELSEEFDPEAQQ